MAMIELKGKAERVSVEDSITTSPTILSADSAEDVRIVRSEAGLPPAQKVEPATQPSLMRKTKEFLVQNAITCVFAVIASVGGALVLAWIET